MIRTKHWPGGRWAASSHYSGRADWHTTGVAERMLEQAHRQMLAAAALSGITDERDLKCEHNLWADDDPATGGVRIRVECRHRPIEFYSAAWEWDPYSLRDCGPAPRSRGRWRVAGHPELGVFADDGPDDSSGRLEAVAQAARCNSQVIPA